MRCNISWWLLLSPLCGPSATKHMNCLPITLKRGHWNCYCIVPNVVCIVKRSGIVIVINIVCVVGKSLET
jgi:hypothetical protein